MRPLEEIKKVMDKTTDKILGHKRWKQMPFTAYDIDLMVMQAKAEAYDEIVGILEKEEKNWWS